MRVYLSVPYDEKDEAKKYGAKWDPKKKLWYSPGEKKELTDRWPVNNSLPITDLIGEDRLYGGNILFVDLIPKSCWFTNVRKCVHFSDWDRLRIFIYERANNQCECCQSKTVLDAHERWSFDEKTKIQKLKRIIALCKPCHEATHMGLAQIRGRGDIAKDHLGKVNGMSKFEAEYHIKKAFELWDKRNKSNWKLDLSIITNSGIKLSQEFDGKSRNMYSKNQTKRVRDLDNISSNLTLCGNNDISINTDETNKKEKSISTLNKIDGGGNESKGIFLKFKKSLYFKYIKYIFTTKSNV